MRESIEKRMAKFFNRMSFLWMVVAVIFNAFDDYRIGYGFLALCLYSELKAHLYRIEDKQSKPQE